MNAVKEKRRTKQPVFTFILIVQGIQNPARSDRITLPSTTLNHMRNFRQGVAALINRIARQLSSDGFYFDYDLNCVILYRNVEVIDGANWDLKSSIVKRPIAYIRTERIDNYDY